MKRTKTILLITVVSICQFSAAKGAVTITVTQVGPNVVFSGSGSFNLSALSVPGFVTNGTSFIDPSGATIIFSGSPDPVEYYSTGTVGGPSSYGIGPGGTPSFSEGDNFGLIKNPSTSFDLFLPQGYISNSPLSGTMTFSNQTFATLGLSEGSYTWSWSADGNNDSVTLNIPEPTISLLGSLTFATALLRRRRSPQM